MEIYSYIPLNVVATIEELEEEEEPKEGLFEIKFSLIFILQNKFSKGQH